MPKILNFGSLNLDYVYTVENFVRPGETILSKDMQVFCGGKGFNQSIALARAGADVFHAGFIGRSDGEIFLKTLRENEVNTDLIMKRDNVGGHAVIQINKAGQNCIILHGGANQTNTEVFIDYALFKFSEGDYIVLQNEINLADEIIRKAKRKGMKVFLNPSPMNDAVKEMPLELVDCFILNEVEAADICDIFNLDNRLLIYSLRDRFPSASILLTLGNKGASYAGGEHVQPLFQKSFEVPVVDTTAAGDTFTGYFLARIATGAAVEDALKYASAAASLAVSRKGAAASVPTMNETQLFLQGRI
ncbi:MAG: ribokinase [Oscillospiraceae bacterium]|nr:ribokinase [Oscillospiraceae bacterium]